MKMDKSKIDELRKGPVKSMEIWKGMTVNELVLQMKDSGSFSSGTLAKAVDIYEQMIKDNAYIFLTLSGALVPAGIKKVIIKSIEKGWVNAIVSTGANLVHDVLEVFGGKHYKGSPYLRDDILSKTGINRIYDVFVTDEDFDEKFDKPIRSIYHDISTSRRGETLSINEFIMEIAKRLPNESSILKSAYIHGVKVFAPAIQDSEYGIEAVRYNRNNNEKLRVDAFKDLEDIWSIREKNEKTGAIILGGGVPKNYIFQSSIFAQKKLDYNMIDYVIQITLDRPETGGLSGATLDEAISWGKIKEVARKVVVVSEITLAFPIIVTALLERFN